MSDFDSAWKEALDALFEPFMAFFFPEAHHEIDWAHGIEMLDKELQQIAPESERGVRVVDKLVKVWRTNGHEEWVLVHVETKASMTLPLPSGCSSTTTAFSIAIIERWPVLLSWATTSPVGGPIGLATSFGERRSASSSPRRSYLIAPRTKPRWKPILICSLRWYWRI